MGRKATESERKQGLDLADYLIKFDYKEFVFPEQSVQFKESTNKFELKPVQNENLLSVNLSEPVFEFEESPKDNWNDEIQKLESFFNQIQVPEQPIQLNDCTKITNVGKFIESYLSTLRTILKIKWF